MSLSCTWLNYEDEPILYNGEPLPDESLDNSLRLTGGFYGNSYASLIDSLIDQNSTLYNTHDFYMVKKIADDLNFVFRWSKEKVIDELPDGYNYDEALSIALMFKWYSEQNSELKCLSSWY